jgi:hypothetical protein
MQCKVQPYTLYQIERTNCKIESPREVYYSSVRYICLYHIKDNHRIDYCRQLPFVFDLLSVLASNGLNECFYILDGNASNHPLKKHFSKELIKVKAKAVMSPPITNELSDTPQLSSLRYKICIGSFGLIMNFFAFM